MPLITMKEVEVALGSLYNPEADYRIVDDKKTVAAMQFNGWRVVGNITDDIFILTDKKVELKPAPPVGTADTSTVSPTRLQKIGGFLNPTRNRGIK